MAIFYALLAITVFTTEPQVVKQTADFYTQVGEGVIRSSVRGIGVYGVVMSLFTTFLVFAPRTDFWYSMHVLNLIAGIIKCCFAPLTIPLLIFWVRPPVRELFNDRANG